jgi:diguanylate cyclase (GGDEF)-like protein
MELLACRDDAERGRLLDLSRRLRKTELYGTVLMLAAAAVSVPTFGVAAFLPPLPVLVLFWVLQSRLDRFRRPELALVLCVALTQASLAASVALATGPRVYLLPLLVLPVLLACSSLPARMAAVLTIFSVLLMVAVALGFDYGEVSDTPFALLYPLAVMISAAGITMVVAGLDVSTRGVAILDTLTGLPNRVALRARAAELEHQSRVNGRPVAILVADPDGFKSINDEHGHAVGDEVLRQVGALLRGALQAGASAYRLGGEEFVLLVGDADEGAGLELAERLRSAIGAAPIGGLAIPTSIGVAASSPGETFSFGRLFGLADRALYEAKRAGGNRVCGASETLSAGAGRAAGRQLGAAEQRGSGHAARASANGAARARAGAHPNGGLGDSVPAEVSGQAQATGGDRWAWWNAKEHAATGNWLVADDLQRRQLLELNRRLRERAKPAFLAGFAVGGASAIQYGWQILVPPLVMTVIYILTEHHIERFRHPEYALGLAWLGYQLSFLLSGLLANAPMIFAAALLLQLLVGSSAVFPPRGVVVGVAVTALIMVVVGVAEDLPLVERAPGILAFDIALVIVVGMIGVAVGRSTIDYRDLAIVDHLTGLFNRAALVTRVAELTHRSADASAPTAVVVIDVDRFKSINDSHGHATGDEVLRQIGMRVRRNLRAFESAYRVGGEEFVVLLDEVDWRHAEQVSSRLCEAIGESPVAGVPVTVSIGLAASSPGERFSYETVFRRADAALYEAKHAGGDRVCAAHMRPSDHSAGAAGAETVLVTLGAQSLQATT